MSPNRKIRTLGLPEGCAAKGATQTATPRAHSRLTVPKSPDNSMIYLVGAAGFEPTTPSPPDWCANRAAPRPDLNGRRTIGPLPNVVLISVSALVSQTFSQAPKRRAW